MFAPQIKGTSFLTITEAVNNSGRGRLWNCKSDNIRLLLHVDIFCPEEISLVIHLIT